MPAQILPTEGLIQQHQDLLAIPRVVLPWYLVLFANDIEPGPDTVLADLVEPTFGGYGRVLLIHSEYQNFVASNGCSHCQWGALPYRWYVTAGPADTIYGWAAIDTLAGVIRRVQRFDENDIGPLTVGGQFLLLPEFTLNSSECATYADSPDGGVAFGGPVSEFFVP